MSALWSSPFLLAQDAEVKAKVRAKNERGDSTISPASVNNAKVEVVPHTMVAPTKGPLTSNS